MNLRSDPEQFREVPAGLLPDLSVIVVNYNTAHLLDRMIDALSAARQHFTIQLIIVDNASTDVASDLLRPKYPDVEWIANGRNVGFGRANNQALPLIRGKYVLLLNTDAFVSPDTLLRTIAFMDQNSRCGILGVRLVSEDGALQPSCRYFPTPWNEFVVATGLQRLFPATRLVDDMSWDHAAIRECDWVPGCYYLMRRELIERIGLFDPRYFLYFEEVDHCMAARAAGWSVVFFPFTEVVHIGGESAKTRGPITTSGRQISALQIESRLLFFRKHYGLKGVLEAILLCVVKVGMAAGKDLVARRRPTRVSGEVAELRASLRSLLATGFATRPTR